MIFEYKAINNSNQIIAGIVEAKSGEMAILLLSKKGLRVVKLNTASSDHRIYYNRILALRRAKRKMTATNDNRETDNETPSNGVVVQPPSFIWNLIKFSVVFIIGFVIVYNIFGSL